MKRFISPLLKLLFSVGLLWFFVGKSGVKLAEVAEEWRRADWLWLAGAGVAYVLLVWCGVLRWQLLLGAQGVRPGLRHTAAIGWVGMFFSAFSVGVVGGDAARVFYILKVAGSRRAGALLSIAVDRICGLAGLCLVALVVLPINWSFFRTSPVIEMIVWVIAGGVGAFALLMLVVIFAEGTVVGRRLFGWIDTMPGQKFIAPLREGVRGYLGAPAACAGAVLLSLGVHGCAILTAWCVSRGLGLPIGLLFMAGMLPIVGVAMALPITISGFGVREGILLLFFEALHLSQAQAIAYSLSFWAITIAVSALGGLVYIWYRTPGEKVGAESAHA